MSPEGVFCQDGGRLPCRTRNTIGEPGGFCRYDAGTAAPPRPRKTGLNSRVRDLVDIVLLLEEGLKDLESVRRAGERR